MPFDVTGELRNMRGPGIKPTLPERLTQNHDAIRLGGPFDCVIMKLSRGRARFAAGAGKQGLQALFDVANQAWLCHQCFSATRNFARVNAGSRDLATKRSSSGSVGLGLGRRDPLRS